MGVRKINTNKEMYERIVEFFPKIEGKQTVTIDVIKELHQLGKDAGFSIPSSNCGGCDNKRIIDNLRAYVYQYEHPDE
jgi:hypothetical protein